MYKTRGVGSENKSRIASKACVFFLLKLYIDLLLFIVIPATSDDTSHCHRSCDQWGRQTFVIAERSIATKHKIHALSRRPQFHLINLVLSFLLIINYFLSPVIKFFFMKCIVFFLLSSLCVWISNVVFPLTSFPIHLCSTHSLPLKSSRTIRYFCTFLSNEGDYVGREYLWLTAWDVVRLAFGEYDGGLAWES